MKILLSWPFAVSSLIVFFLALGMPSRVSYQSFYMKPASSVFSLTSQNLIDGVPVASVITSEQSSLGLPIRLKIPKINIDASVEYVGVAPDGTMDVPKGSANVAWFELGPRPGEQGSAVIAGHYGWWENLRQGSVFDNLHTLRKGDKIYIEDSAGEIISFVVRESKRFDPKADTSDIFGSSDGRAHLNLITCEGVWDKVFRNYSKRLVVFADKEIE